VGLRFFDSRKPLPFNLVKVPASACSVAQPSLPILTKNCNI